MQPSLIVLALAFVLFVCSCAGSGETAESKILPNPDVKQPTEPEKPSPSESGKTTPEKPASTPPVTPADASARPGLIVPRLLVNGGEVALQGYTIDVHVETPLTLEYPSTQHWFVFERKGNEVLLDTSPPSPQTRRVTIKLAEFTGDRDWFFLARPQDLSTLEKENLVKKLSNFTAPVPKKSLGNKATWKLFSTDSQAMDVPLLAEIRTTLLPFASELRLKKQGETEFHLFFPDDVIESQGEMKIKLKILQKTHLAVFHECGPESIDTLFPTKDSQTMEQRSQSMEPSTEQNIPSTGGFSVGEGEKANQERLWFFYGDQPMSCSDLKEKIKISRGPSTNPSDYGEETAEETSNLKIPLLHR